MLYEFTHATKFNELFNSIVLYPKEGSIAETSFWNILQHLFYNILNSRLLTTLRGVIIFITHVYYGVQPMHLQLTKLKNATDAHCGRCLLIMDYGST